MLFFLFYFLFFKKTTGTILKIKTNASNPGTGVVGVCVEVLIPVSDVSEVSDPVPTNDTAE